MTELDDRIDAGRHDVFTRAGLGPTVRRAYESFTADEQNPETIATRAGLPLGRARAAIARLRRHSLAIATPTGWRRRLHDLRRHAARLLGVDGILARRSQQYAHEREQWAWWNADVTYRAGRTPKQQTRRGPGHPVMFRTTDDRGDDTMWPAYPRTAGGWGDHNTAWRFVRRGLVQELRDVELVA